MPEQAATPQPNSDPDWVRNGFDIIRHRSSEATSKDDLASLLEMYAMMSMMLAKVLEQGALNVLAPGEELWAKTEVPTRVSIDEDRAVVQARFDLAEADAAYPPGFVALLRSIIRTGLASCEPAFEAQRMLREEATVKGEPGH
jgi:hypothetical protein